MTDLSDPTVSVLNNPISVKGKKPMNSFDHDAFEASIIRGTKKRTNSMNKINNAILNPANAMTDYLSLENSKSTSYGNFKDFVFKKVLIKQYETFWLLN